MTADEARAEAASVKRALDGNGRRGKDLLNRRNEIMRVLLADGEPLRKVGARFGIGATAVAIAVGRYPNHGRKAAGV